MVQAQWFTGKDNLDEIHKIRTEVFIKEQGVTEEVEYDGTDEKCQHLLITDNGVSVGTGRILMNDGQFFLGRIAVLKEYRRQKLGDFIVRLLIRKAYELGGEKQIVHAQTRVKGFYEKLGFAAVGEEYMEAGIPHITMERFGDITGHCGE